MRLRATVGVLLAVSAVSSGCGAAARDHPAVAARPYPARAAEPPASRPGTASSAPAVRRSAAPAPSAARQLVTVTAASYGATYAVLAAYTADPAAGGRWHRLLGPWTARLGNGGLAPPGQKREGDGRTPSGTYRFGFFFGLRPNPGVAFPYRQSQPDDVWDDD